MESSGPTAAPEPGDAQPPSTGHDYPLTFSVDYPDRQLDRLSSALRIFWVIPIAILAATIEGGSFSTGSGARYGGGGIGLLVVPVVLMLLFRKKYPRWWYDWNLQLSRFSIGSWSISEATDATVGAVSVLVGVGRARRVRASRGR